MVFADHQVIFLIEFHSLFSFSFLLFYVFVIFRTSITSLYVYFQLPCMLLILLLETPFIQRSLITIKISCVAEPGMQEKRVNLMRLSWLYLNLSIHLPRVDK